MVYTGKKLKEIIFPLGGIGTGSIGLAGNGSFKDFEIRNRPAKGSSFGRMHFAIRAVDKCGRVSVKILNSDVEKDYMGHYAKSIFGGYGFGVSGSSMAGFPHFKSCVFDGRFPIATLTFTDDSFPAKVTLTAFNPLIPLNSFDSSLPAAFFNVEVENTSEEDYEFSVILVSNNNQKGALNREFAEDGFSGIYMSSDAFPENSPKRLDLTVATDGEQAILQESWYRGRWQDGISTYWRELSGGGIPKRHFDEPNANGEHCTVGATLQISAKSRDCAKFLFSWNAPNFQKYWEGDKAADEQDITWRTYYSTVFENSLATARYAFKNWDRLYAKTLEFTEALHSSTLDKAVIDAAASTLSVIKSSTVTRLTDGSFYGFEGVHEQYGSCEGTCQHVWNYAYALCFLFPDLERSIRDLEQRYSTSPAGKMKFRLELPLGRNESSFRACLDGQMGSVIKIYREWKISGDSKWLKDKWEHVKSVIGYAWSEENPDRWDRNRDGILEGRQHHTLDMELFGPSSWLQGFYLGALKAAAEMASELGDTAFQTECLKLFRNGYEFTKNELFCGTHFIQRVDLKDKTPTEFYEGAEEYWNAEAGELKYQIGEGCIIDQLLAQWHANICGLGDIFDKAQRKIALESLYRNNYKKRIGDVANCWRLFAINNESGTIMCDYPEGVYKPIIPIPYCEEVMTGFEYALAGLMVSEGMICEGLDLVRAVRERYDGEKRNPYNEIECGSNYARAMASFALLPLFSGFEFDMAHGYLALNPKVNRNNYSCLFSLGSGWGRLHYTENKAKISLLGGELTLNTLKLEGFGKALRVIADGQEISFTQEGDLLSFNSTSFKREIVVTK